MMTKKKRKMVLIGIPVVIILVLAIMVIILYLNTDMFKSSQTLFFKYFGKNFDSFYKVTESIENEDYNKFIESNKYNEKASFQINYTDNYETTSEATDNAINKLKIIEEGKTDKENDYQYKNIKLLNQDESEMQIEYIKNKDNHGVKFSDIFNQYIVVENNNLKDLFEKLGYSDEEIQNIPDAIEIQDVNKVKFSEEELSKLESKYVNLVSNKISKDKFSKKEKQIIEINDQNISTNAYILTLTKEELNNIYLDILETIKEDEIIISKIEQLQNLLNIKINEDLQINLKEKYVDFIEKTIEKINKTNIGNDESSITVYEKNGTTIKTIIKTPDYEICFNHLNSDEESFTEISIRKNDKEVNSIVLKNNPDSLDVTIKDNNTEEIKELSFSRKQNINDNSCEKNIDITYKDNNNKLEAKYLEKLDKTNELDFEEEFNEDNIIKLNDLQTEQLQAIIERVRLAVSDKTTNTLDKINLEDIQKILKNLGIKKETTLEKERNI